jgi:hypothetical protein
MIAEHVDPVSGFALIIDADDRVVYAYLLDVEQEIVADVWLCNLIDAPSSPEWKTRPPDPPYLNPLGFCDDGFRVSHELHVRWHHNEQRLHYLEVLDGGRTIARLAPGDKPGFNIAALKDGPLSRRF